MRDFVDKRQPEIYVSLVTGAWNPLYLKKV